MEHEHKVRLKVTLDLIVAKGKLRSLAKGMVKSFNLHGGFGVDRNNDFHKDVFISNISRSSLSVLIYFSDMDEGGMYWAELYNEIEGILKKLKQEKY